MNYYDHHIGDYTVATSHLSFVEDAAYSRMIRKYLSLEKPLPAELVKVQRLVGARTKEEKNAVASVLEEFFILQADGWHNTGCDLEIEKFLDGEPEREVKKANEVNRLKKHREERAALFMRLTAAGQHAPWNINIAELRELVKRIDGVSAPPETETATQPATAPATPATATQYPVPNTHYPVLKTKGISSSSGTSLPDEEIPESNSALPGTRIGSICKLLRTIGINAAPGQFQKPGWDAIFERFDDAMILAVAEAKRAASPDKSISAAYLLPVLTDMLKPPQQQGARPAYESERDRSRRETNEALTGKKQDENRPKLIDLN